MIFARKNVILFKKHFFEICYNLLQIEAIKIGIERTCKEINKMLWEDILKIVASAIASVGGAGAIIWALSSFFGKMWANKILEKQKAEFQKDI